MIFAGESISKRYGDLQVLSNVSIACKAGDIHGLIGANGAGKTTLFKILLGLVTPDSGTVNYYGNGVKKVGGIVEKPALYGYLNAPENLKVFAGIQGISLSKNKNSELLERVGLLPGRKDPVSNYSTGMKQRLGIAIAMLNNPSCLILDEPFSGLDPLGITNFRTFILKLAQEEGLCILLSSHIIGEMHQLCNHLSILKDGRITHSDSAKKITTNLFNSYQFYGPNIEQSKVLKDHGAVYDGNCMKLEVPPNKMASILGALSKEQTQLTGMIPNLDLDALFKSTPQ